MGAHKSMGICLDPRTGKIRVALLRKNPFYGNGENENRVWKITEWKMRLRKLKNVHSWFGLDVIHNQNKHIEIWLHFGTP